MIESIFPNLPPKNFLHLIMDPASKIYVFLWERQDPEHKLTIAWKELSLYFHPRVVRNALRRLLDVGLVGYSTTDQELSVELVAWDDLDDVE